MKATCIDRGHYSFFFKGASRFAIKISKYKGINFFIWEFRDSCSAEWLMNKTSLLPTVKVVF